MPHMAVRFSALFNLRTSPTASWLHPKRNQCLSMKHSRTGDDGLVDSKTQGRKKACGKKRLAEGGFAGLDDEGEGREYSPV